MAAKTPAPAPVLLTQEQLEWLDRQAQPWRLALMASGAVVVVVMVALTVLSISLETTTTESTSVRVAPSSASSATSDGSSAQGKSGSKQPDAQDSSTPTPTSTPTSGSTTGSTTGSDAADLLAPSPALSLTASKSASTSATTASDAPSNVGDSDTVTVTSVDDARPSDTLLATGWAVGLLLLLAGAFFMRATKLSAAGMAVEWGAPLPPGTQEVVDEAARAFIQQNRLDPEVAARFHAGATALARDLNARSSVDAETLARLATEGTASSLKLM